MSEQLRKVFYIKNYLTLATRSLFFLVRTENFFHISNFTFFSTVKINPTGSNKMIYTDP